MGEELYTTKNYIIREDSSGYLHVVALDRIAAATVTNQNTVQTIKNEIVSILNADNCDSSGNAMYDYDTYIDDLCENVCELYNDNELPAFDSTVKPDRGLVSMVEPAKHVEPANIALPRFRAVEEIIERLIKSDEFLDDVVKLSQVG